MSQIYYSHGVAVQGEFKGQKLFVTVTDASDGVRNHTSPAVGAVYYGSLLDGMITPILSLHSFTTPKQDAGGLSGNAAAPKKTFSYLAAGANLNLLQKQLLLSIDYCANNYKNKTTENKNDSDNSFMLGLKYNHAEKGVARPLLKYENSKQKVSGAKYMDRQAYTLGVEAYPRIAKANKNEGLRLHAVYTSYTDTYKTGVDASGSLGAKTTGKKITTSQLLFGLTLNI